MAGELAAATGKSKTDAVIDALRAELCKVRAARGTSTLAVRIGRIADRCSQLPVLDDRSADEILGYDEIGLPNP